MTRFIFAGVSVIVGFALLLGLAPQGSSQDEMQQLRVEVANMGLRIDKLEHASGSSAVAPSSGAARSGSARSGSGGSAGSPARTMILAAVSQSDHTANNADQIAHLQRKNASLMNAVDQVSADQAESAGQDTYVGRSSEGERGWGQASGSTVMSTNIGAGQRQVIADENLKQRYVTEAYISREKLKKLKAANAVPKQIIHGHDDKVIYTLETKTNLSDQLNNIAIGDTVTWTGTRKDADATSETWIVTSIHKVGN